MRECFLSVFAPGAFIWNGAHKHWFGQSYSNQFKTKSQCKWKETNVQVFFVANDKINIKHFDFGIRWYVFFDCCIAYSVWKLADIYFAFCKWWVFQRYWFSPLSWTNSKAFDMASGNFPLISISSLFQSHWTINGKFSLITLFASDCLSHPIYTLTDSCVAIMMARAYVIAAVCSQLISFTQPFLLPLCAHWSHWLSFYVFSLHFVQCIPGHWTYWLFVHCLFLFIAFYCNVMCSDRISWYVYHWFIVFYHSFCDICPFR